MQKSIGNGVLSYIPKVKVNVTIGSTIILKLRVRNNRPEVYFRDCLYPVSIYSAIESSP